MKDYISNFKGFKNKLNEQDSSNNGLVGGEDTFNTSKNPTGTDSGDNISNLQIEMDRALKNGVIDQSQYESALDILNLKDPKTGSTKSSSKQGDWPTDETTRDGYSKKSDDDGNEYWSKD